MRIIGMILTGLICLLSLVFLGYNIPKQEKNTMLPVLVWLLIIASVSGIVFLILLGLSLRP